MNSSATNVGGWPASDMYSYLNVTEKEGSGTIYNSLPEELRNAIIDTKVISSHGRTSGEENFTSTDKLYLLSTREVWGKEGTSNQISNDTADGETITRQLDYYKAQNVSTSSYSGAIKKLNGTEKWWWLRSATGSSGSSFYSVSYHGAWSDHNATNSNGVSPAFRIAS